LARRNAPKAKLHHASAFAFDLPPCDAVTAIGEVLCYLPVSKDGPAKNGIPRATRMNDWFPGSAWEPTVRQAPPALPPLIVANAGRAGRAGQTVRAEAEPRHELVAANLTRGFRRPLRPRCRSGGGRGLRCGR
jgi:hypothetical protein